MGIRWPWKRKHYGQVSIVRHKNGQFSVWMEGNLRMLDLRTVSPDEKMEAIKSLLLANGYVWTDDLERKVGEMVYKRP